MDEVDNIIIHTLRNIGCDIDEEINSIKQFTDEIIIKSAVSCLETITPGTGLPKFLPSSMSLRLRTATSIAQLIQDLGYRGDMGYQTLLYSNEADIRRLFMFLVERLPRDTDKSVQIKAKGRFELLQSDIRSVISNELKKSWKSGNENIHTPFYSKNLIIPETYLKNISQDKKEYWARYLPPITEQCSVQEIIPSLIAFNDCNTKTIHSVVDLEKKLFEAVRSTSEQNISEIKDLKIEVALTNASENQEDAIEQTTKKMKEFSVGDIKNKIENVTNEIDNLKTVLQTLEEDIKTLSVKEKQILEQKKMEQESLENTVRQLKIKSKSYKLLPNKEENIVKLKELIEANTDRLTSLANQWNKHRIALIDEYRTLQEIVKTEASQTNKLEKECKEEKQKFKDLEEEICNKNILCKQLQDEVAKLSKTINRFAYTHRIMEIIGNIRKQRSEMDKILEDTKSLQKEINKLTGKLERSYFLTDEVIYRDAKQDEIARKAYKLLVSLHSDCNELVQVTKQTGDIVRECRDLQDQIDVEKSQDIGTRIQRIVADLEQVRKETASLEKSKLKI